jgi:hypothetical protein
MGGPFAEHLPSRMVVAGTKVPEAAESREGEA